MKQKQMSFRNSLAFFYNPADVGNLISGSSAFSKSSLYIWKFLVYILLKPSLKDFEHYLASMEMSTIVRQFQHYLPLPFFGLGMKLTFPSPLATAEFFKFAGMLSAALSQHHLLGFEIAQLKFHNLQELLVVMLPKAHLTSHSRMSGSWLVTTPSWLSGSIRLLCTVLLCILDTCF